MQLLILPGLAACLFTTALAQSEQLSVYFCQHLEWTEPCVNLLGTPGDCGKFHFPTKEKDPKRKHRPGVVLTLVENMKVSIPDSYNDQISSVGPDAEAGNCTFYR
ncbi:hypothetical protein IMZ48_45465 [Candidatus Bathyarchaeota archaeon]|nr:hypothetical protein [Candidatus Bathyarchaeota archaeon]